MTTLARCNFHSASGYLLVNGCSRIVLCGKTFKIYKQISSYVQELLRFFFDFFFKVLMLLLLYPYKISDNRVERELYDNLFTDCFMSNLVTFSYNL